MSIRIDFPTTADVYGGGHFFTWGDHQLPFTQVSKISLTCNGVTTDQPVTMVAVAPGTTGITWFAYVHNTAYLDQEVTLKVYGRQNSPTELLGDEVTFTCRGHLAAAPPPARSNSRQQQKKLQEQTI